MNVHEYMNTLTAGIKVLGSLIIGDGVEYKKERIQGMLIKTPSGKLWFYHNDKEYDGVNTDLLPGYTYTWVLKRSATDYEENSFELDIFHNMEEIIKEVDKNLTELENKLSTLKLQHGKNT